MSGSTANVLWISIPSGSGTPSDALLPSPLFDLDEHLDTEKIFTEYRILLYGQQLVAISKKDPHAPEIIRQREASIAFHKRAQHFFLIHLPVGTGLIKD